MYERSSAKKSLGQHFLMHRQTAERIVDAAGVTNTDTVLEIGPGTGLLTRVLLAKAQKVIAVEADRDLIPQLRETFAQEIAGGKLQIIESDIRAFSPDLIKEDYKLVANIPYYITGEIFRQFLSAAHKPASMTLLVQKEVAERIARTKKESLLSLSVKAYGTPKYDFTVPKGAFVPAPKVDSAVLSISGIHSPFKNNAEEERFFAILHAGFAHKRKQLLKNLESIISNEAARTVLTDAELPLMIRAEDVTLAVWKKFAETE